MAEDTETTETELAPGFHVTLGGEHNSGPYETREDAEAFNVGHLKKKGKIIEVKP